MLLGPAQACVRSTYLLAEKLEFMDTTPWLFAKLHLPEVRDLGEVPAEALPLPPPHAVSIACLGPQSELTNDVRAVNSDGTGMSERLASAWKILSNMPMDDSKGEDQTRP